MKSLVVIALALGTFVVAAQAQAQSQPKLPQIVQETVDKVRKDCDEKFQLLPGFATVRDINDDKVPDYILDYGKARCGNMASFYCGTGGCLTQVFASANDTHVLVLDENVRRVRFARVKGRPAMLLDLHGGICGRAGAEACAATLYWNGATFHPAN
jgi:hypothetical protein